MRAVLAFLAGVGAALHVLAWRHRTHVEHVATGDGGWAAYCSRCGPVSPARPPRDVAELEAGAHRAELWAELFGALRRLGR